MKFHRILLTGLIIMSLGALAGCARYAVKSSASESLASVIDTVRDSRQSTQAAALEFPASVAVIFVPGKVNGVSETVLHRAEVKLKEQLLANPKYIRSVTIVSVDVVRSKVSLRQIRSMYDADIAVILSYRQDQVQQQSGPGGVMDATLVGALVVPSVETKTATLVDGSVIHIPNNAILFTGSGSDERRAFSTTYGVPATRAEQSNQGVVAATESFGRTITKTLDRFDNFDFSQAVTLSVSASDGTAYAAGTGETGDQWNKVNSFKLSGGGSIDPLTMAIMLPFALPILGRRR